MDKQALIDRLRDKGLRVTQARIDVFEFLQKSTTSVTAKELFSSIRGSSKADLVSIYRNLFLFDELGLAHRFQDGRYSRCGQSQDDNHEHLHLISHCSGCGKSSEIKTHSKQICQLMEQLKKTTDMLETHQEVVIQGRCSGCS